MLFISAINKKYKKPVKFLLIYLLIFGWIFSGWPMLWQNPPIPPRIQQAKAAVPAGIIVAWPYASSTIPAGWYRDDTLDGYFLKSVPNNSTNPGATGGAATHNHTSPAHNHTQDSHQHLSNPNSGVPSATIGKHTAGGDNLLSSGTHTHTVPDSNANTATNQATVATIGHTSSDPPYQQVLWIYSDGTTDIPDDAVAFFNSATLPTDWTATSTGKFYKGAAALSDPGADGGADSHTHSSDHNHIQDAHNHTSAASGSDIGASDQGTSNPANSATAGHTHSITWSSETATNQSASGNVDTISYLPPYLGLVAIDNDTGGVDTPNNVIAIWRGNLASIPANWELCGSGETCDIDVFDRFVMATSTANIGNTGGSAGHSHTASPHTHIQDPHTHTITLADAGLSAVKRTNDNSGPDGTTENHTHSGTSASATATNQNTTITVDNNADTRPLFYEVVFIQYQPAAVSLTFTVTTDNFGNITAGSQAHFATSTLNVNTDNSSGWNITLYGHNQGSDSASTTMYLTGPDYNINFTDQKEWIPGSATSTHVGATSVRIGSFDNSQDVMAFRVMTASSTNGGCFYAPTWWGSADHYTDNANTLWAGIASSTVGRQIGNAGLGSYSASDHLNTVLYYLKVPSTQQSGNYTGDLTFTATTNP